MENRGHLQYLYGLQHPLADPRTNSELVFGKSALKDGVRVRTLLLGQINCHLVVR